MRRQDVIGLSRLAPQRLFWLVFLNDFLVWTFKKAAGWCLRGTLEGTLARLMLHTGPNLSLLGSEI